MGAGKQQPVDQSGATALPLTTQYQFDANGNLIRQNTEKHHVWDHADRMIGFQVQPKRQQFRIHSGALPLRRRRHAREEMGAQRQRQQPRHQHLHRRHVRAPPLAAGWRRPEQHAARDGRPEPHCHGAGWAAIRTTDAQRVQYHLGDHLGSSHLVVGGDRRDGQTFINREEYFPYGETSFGSFGRKRYRYSGKERDEESGLYYYGARYLAPWLAGG
jgi:hypothetical protein